MNKENLLFLRDLKKELAEQDTDWQASPRFWVIRQHEKKLTHPDFSEGALYFYNDGDYTEFETLEDLQEFADSYLTDKDNAEIYQLIKTGFNMDDVFNEIEDNYNDEGFFERYDYRCEAVIKDTTMFLTKKEAQEHLHRYQHYYNKSAHTYAMTARESLKYKKLLNVLDEIDWDKVIGLYEDHIEQGGQDNGNDK